MVLSADRIRAQAHSVSYPITRHYVNARPMHLSLILLFFAEKRHLRMQSSPPVVQSQVQSAMQYVYLWMAAGLLVTAAISSVVLNNSSIWGVIFSPYVFLGLIIVEVIVVIAMSALVMRVSPGVAIGLLVLYAALNGITITPIAFTYTASSIAAAFFTTAGSFAGLALYGMTTKRDLSGIGKFMMMALFGVCIATVINIFLHNAFIDYVMSIMSVFIFAGLTVYDTQRLNQIAQQMHGDDRLNQFAVYGALTLYLDFINLFVNILRILGKRRD